MRTKYLRLTLLFSVLYVGNTYDCYSGGKPGRIASNNSETQQRITESTPLIGTSAKTYNSTLNNSAINNTVINEDDGILDIKTLNTDGPEQNKNIPELEKNISTLTEQNQINRQKIMELSKRLSNVEKNLEASYVQDHTPVETGDSVTSNMKNNKVFFQNGCNKNNNQNASLSGISQDQLQKLIDVDVTKKIESITKTLDTLQTELKTITGKYTELQINLKNCLTIKQFEALKEKLNQEIETVKGNCITEDILNEKIANQDFSTFAKITYIASNYATKKEVDEKAFVKNLENLFQIDEDAEEDNSLHEHIANTIFSTTAYNDGPVNMINNKIGAVQKQFNTLQQSIRK